MKKTTDQIEPPLILPGGLKNIWVYPPMSDPDRLHREGLLQRVRAFADTVEPGSVVVDVGCGWLPYKNWFLKDGVTYIPTDVTPYPDPDFRQIQSGLPVADASVDVIVCWQVAEHVEELDSFFADLKRTLKPGGRICFTTHGLFRIHAKEDYWRWTPEGLRLMCAKHGLELLSLEPCDSCSSILASLFNDILARGFGLRGKHGSFPSRKLGGLLIGGANILAMAFDKIMDMLPGALHRTEASTYIMVARAAKAEVAPTPVPVEPPVEQLPFVTVAVCTHNRASDLNRLLGSFLNLTYPKDRYEILVVDNASTDKTADVCRTHEAKLERLRYVREDQLGLPFARNAGWKNSNADLIAYIDDDATVQPGWLEGLGSAYVEQVKKNRVFAMGGAVKLACESGEIPSWIPPHMMPWLSALDYGRDTFVLDGTPLCLVGANFAVPRDVLKSIGGFNENIRANSCDERWVEQKVRDLGGSLVYVGSSRINHFVPASRLTRNWFEGRLFQEGRNLTLYRRQREPKSPLGESLLGVRKLLGVVKALAAVLYSTMFDRNLLFERKCRLAFACGTLKAQVALIFSGRK